MQNNIVYRLELTDKEFKYLEDLKQEYYNKLNQMTKEQRLQYFRDNIAIEKNLNFKKEIKGTIYKVNAYFNEKDYESILDKFFRLTKNS